MSLLSIYASLRTIMYYVSYNSTLLRRLVFHLVYKIVQVGNRFGAVRMALRDIYISRLGEGTVNFDLVSRFRNLQTWIFDRLFGSAHM